MTRWEIGTIPSNQGKKLYVNIILLQLLTQFLPSLCYRVIVKIPLD
jgi:hypothetical protein